MRILATIDHTPQLRALARSPPGCAHGPLTALFRTIAPDQLEDQWIEVQKSAYAHIWDLTRVYTHAENYEIGVNNPYNVNYVRIRNIFSVDSYAFRYLIFALNHLF